MQKISYEMYLDKAYGAWAGKCAGGIIGAEQENNKNVLHYTFENVFPSQIPPNDDFDLQILFLQEVLEKKGFSFNAADLAETFTKHNTCWANEYRTAMRNVNAGIMPPTSGLFGNEFFQYSLGCPIRSELWGLVAIGNPELAVSFVERDGCIDHGIESIEAEKFNAVMECLAFFDDDLNSLIEKSQSYVNPDTELYRCIRFVKERVQTCDDWKKIRAELIAEFGSCDASYAVVNMGITLIALFCGKKNFNDTMMIAVNCGYDTDCTSATAGAVLGIMLGKSRMDSAWLEKIGESFVVGTVNIRRERNTLTQLTEDTFRLAYALVRDKRNDICFTDMPENYTCDVPVYAPNVTISVKYEGEPSVCVAHGCDFEATFENATTCTVAGKIGYTLTEGAIDVTLEKDEIEIPPMASVTVKGRATAVAGKWLPLCNVGTLYLDDGKERRKVRLGFLGAAKYRLYGPFFDNYDTKKYDHDIYGEKRQGGGMADLFPMFNGYVNIERAYVENEGNISDALPHKVFYSAEDKLPIQKYVKYKGPCCVYLEKRVYSETEQTLQEFIGYTAPYKLYVNGELVSEHKGGNVCWMPLNAYAELKLRAGENKIVYKLERNSGAFEFSSFTIRKQTADNGLLPDCKMEY